MKRFIKAHRYFIWILCFIMLVGGMLGGIGMLVMKIDPFMHYHLPDTDDYYYTLDSERYINNGILRHFDYEGMITGSSLTENFKASEAEMLWNCPFVKTCFQGGEYYEVNRAVSQALKYNSNLKTVIRGLDLTVLYVDKDYIHAGTAWNPLYLLDENIFNDVEYLFNRDVLFTRVYTMIKNKNAGEAPGITSFDDYRRWSGDFPYGKDALYPNGIKAVVPGTEVLLNKDEKKVLLENIRQNVTELPARYPEVTFYYFFPPYSIQWWQLKLKRGELEKDMQAVRLMTEEILQYDNIKLFWFGSLRDIATDLNNYKDYIHYGEWVNSLMLHAMKKDQYLLTKDNYEEILTKDKEFYKSFDVEPLNMQEDYENDAFAASLMRAETYGISPIRIDPYLSAHVELSLADLSADQYQGKPGIICTGSLDRNYSLDSEEEKAQLSAYIRHSDYNGFKTTIKDITPYQSLVFYGRKDLNHGQPTVCFFDESGKLLKFFQKRYSEIDNEWHQYMIDVSDLEGPVEVYFQGGYTDRTGNTYSQFVFSDIGFY